MSLRTAERRGAAIGHGRPCTTQRIPLRTTSEAGGPFAVLLPVGAAPAAVACPRLAGSAQRIVGKLGLTPRGGKARRGHLLAHLLVLLDLLAQSIVFSLGHRPHLWRKKRTAWSTGSMLKHKRSRRQGGARRGVWWRGRHRASRTRWSVLVSNSIIRSLHTIIRSPDSTNSSLDGIIGTLIQGVAERVQAGTLRAWTRCSLSTSSGREPSTSSFSFAIAAVVHRAESDAARRGRASQLTHAHWLLELRPADKSAECPI